MLYKFLESHLEDYNKSFGARNKGVRDQVLVVVIIIICVTTGSDKKDWNKLGVCSESLYDLSPITKGGILNGKGESLNLCRILKGSSSEFGGDCILGAYVYEGCVLVVVRSFKGQIPLLGCELVYHASHVSVTSRSLLMISVDFLPGERKTCLGGLGCKVLIHPTYRHGLDEFLSLIIKELTLTGCLSIVLLGDCSDSVGRLIIYVEQDVLVNLNILPEHPSSVSGRGGASDHISLAGILELSKLSILILQKPGVEILNPLGSLYLPRRLHHKVLSRQEVYLHVQPKSSDC